MKECSGDVNGNISVKKRRRIVGGGGKGGGE